MVFTEGKELVNTWSFAPVKSNNRVSRHDGNRGGCWAKLGVGAFTGEHIGIV